MELKKFFHILKSYNESNLPCTLLSNFSCLIASQNIAQAFFNMQEMFLRVCKLMFLTIPNIFCLSETMINESLNNLDQTNLQLIQGSIVKSLAKNY